MNLLNLSLLLETWFTPPPVHVVDNMIQSFGNLSLGESILEFIVKNDHKSSNIKLFSLVNHNLSGLNILFYKGIIIVACLIVIIILLYKLAQKNQQDWSDHPDFLALSSLSKELLFKFDLKTEQIDFFDNDNNKVSSNIMRGCKHLENAIVSHLKKNSNGGVTMIEHCENNQVFHVRIYHLRPEHDTRWIIGKIVDIDEEVKQKERLINKARIDGLTNLYNASFTTETVRCLIEEKENFNKDVLILMDINRFKNINDTYGHLRGDFVLQEVSRCLKLAFKTACVIGRMGGDEFLVYIKNVDINELKCNEIETFLQIIKDIDFPVEISMSLGVSVVYNQRNYEIVFNEADVALYQVKRERTDNQSSFFIREIKT